MPVDNARPDVDVRLLVRWLGPQGAEAGLEKSKGFTIDALAAIAADLGIKFPKSTTRQQMIAEIVKVANRRIDKPVEDLVKMSHDELVAYLERVDPAREELLDLLKGIDATPSKEGRRGLIEFAARELSETGRFIRIAAGGSRGEEKTR